MARRSVKIGYQQLKSLRGGSYMISWPDGCGMTYIVTALEVQP